MGTAVENALGSILRVRSGATCYPIGDGRHVMVSVDHAAVVTLAAPERLEVLALGDGPRDIKPDQLLRDLQTVGRALRGMVPHRVSHDRGE